MFSQDIVISPLYYSVSHPRRPYTCNFFFTDIESRRTSGGWSCALCFVSWQNMRVHMRRRACIWLWRTQLWLKVSY